jgi:hypothetical protein
VQAEKFKAMKIFINLILIAFLLKVVACASISRNKCEVENGLSFYGGNSSELESLSENSKNDNSKSFQDLKVEKSFDISKINFVKFFCISEEKKKIYLNFTIKWDQKSFQDDPENFNEATKNYLKYLIIEHRTNSAKFKILRVNSSDLKDEERNLDVKMNCKDKNLENCIEVVRKMLENFNCFDLMMIYQDAGIETSVNTGKFFSQ